MDGRGNGDTGANETYYAELRSVAQTLRAAAQEAVRQLTPTLRDETPEWLLERLDALVRSAETTAAEVGRFIRQDQAGTTVVPPPGYDHDVGE